MRILTTNTQKNFKLMDYLERILEALRKWGEKIIETLLGPEAEPETELIPVPVNEPQRRR